MFKLPNYISKECCVKIGGHQADILTCDIPHTRLEWHTLNLVINNLGSKSKSPSKYIHALCISSPKQTPWTLSSSTLPSLSYTCTEFLAGPGIWNGMLQTQKGHLIPSWKRHHTSHHNSHVCFCQHHIIILLHTASPV
jgi:hypothetical protein